MIESFGLTVMLFCSVNFVEEAVSSIICCSEQLAKNNSIIYMHQFFISQYPNPCRAQLLSLSVYEISRSEVTISYQKKLLSFYKAMQYIRAQQGDSIDFYSVAQNKIRYFYSVTANKQDWLFIILLLVRFSIGSRSLFDRSSFILR